jgi:hypothetical protein
MRLFLEEMPGLPVFRKRCAAASRKRRSGVPK